MKESCLDELKKEYAKLQKKYSLPSYLEMNEEFDIEKIQDKETDTLLREIRKIMLDKAIAYLRFIEMLLNPSNAPMFFFSLLKGVEGIDRKLFEDTYTMLGRLEIEVIVVDNDYSEAGEAGFINHMVKEWKTIKENIAKISKILLDGWEKKTKRKEKSYLG